MRYVATFWTRAFRPGQARFGWTAYRQIQPFVDAPVPGSSTLELDTAWRPFCFTADEGWDFFADESRYLMLTFHAATDRVDERTLWIDDVVVTEAKSPRSGRLVNPATLSYDRLAHHLRPGDRLALTVDASRKLREAPRAVGGVSFHRVAGWAELPFDRQGRYVLSPGLEDAIRQLRLPMTRFYALGDEPFGLEAALDRVAEFTDRIGVPQEATLLEFEIQGATSQLSPETWARGVRHSVDRHYGFSRVEGVLLSHPDRDGDPLLDRKQDLVHEFPVELAGDHIEDHTPRIPWPSSRWPDDLLPRIQGGRSRSEEARSSLGRWLGRSLRRLGGSGSPEFWHPPG